MTTDAPDSEDAAGTTDEATDLATGHPVLLFDGVCNLCNASVRFVIRNDPEGKFRFAPLQSETGRELLATCGRGVADSVAGGESDDDFGTVVLVEDGRCYTKSEAALRVASELGFPYSPLGAFRLVPRPIRDAVYDFVAANRYDWFGRKEACMVPTPELESRFLE